MMYLKVVNHFWSTVGFGYDNTGICLLEIDKNDNVKKMIDYNYGNNVVNIEGNLIEKNEMIKGQDRKTFIYWK